MAGVWRAARVCLAAVIAILGSAVGGWAQQNAQEPKLYGLPAPDPRMLATFDTLLAGLDRSPRVVVAEVGTETVTFGDVAESLRAMPRVVSGIPFEEIYQSATLQVMARKALAQVAARKGVESEPTIARRMKNAAEDVLASEYLRRSLEPAVSNEALRPVYDREIAPKIVVDEARARIIMVKSSQEASDLIAKLDGGADFGELARLFSKDGTAPNGGDLGFVRLQALAPEIGAVVFALAPGQTTRYPVRSGAWWFVIRVDARGQKGPPPFEEARGDLARDVMLARIPDLKLEAMREVDVKFRDVPSTRDARQGPREAATAPPGTRSP